MPEKFFLAEERLARFYEIFLIPSRSNATFRSMKSRMTCRSRVWYREASFIAAARRALIKCCHTPHCVRGISLILLSLGEPVSNESLSLRYVFSEVLHSAALRSGFRLRAQTPA